MQKFFIFVDTETYPTTIDDKTELLKLKLGWAIFWNRPLNIIEYFYFKDVKSFWKWVKTKTDICGNILMYAHNMDFDFKILDGYNYLFKNLGFKQKSFYIQGRTFIIKTIRNKKTLDILDTMNYIPVSLKKLGKTVGLNKTDIDFKSCTEQELKIYCKNDVTIIYLFIKQLIEFLIKYNLSKLKPTSASLSFNIFRHHFYNKKNNPIYIHNWYKAIQLERDSYKGGISDCLRIGKFKEKLFKLDINSMYPYLMNKHKMPIKLLYYQDKVSSSYKKMSKTLSENINKYLCIADCNIYLPKEYAYILSKVKVNKMNKSVFLSGNFRTSLTTPELKFVLKYGKINKVYSIACYESKNIFKDFVNFFYNKRQEFIKQKKDCYQMFCKLLLNSLYGKFGQTTIKYNKLGETEETDFKSIIIYNGITDKKQLQIQMGNEIYDIEKTNLNSFDSFVAIPSFITAYARMYLIELLLKAKRKNCYYMDTDCLIVNQEGYNKLKSYINNTKLGMLKIEETSNLSKFYRPKFYTFNEKPKCKGIKHNAIKLKETKDNIIFQQEQFERFKTSLKKDNLNCQIITTIIKNMNKIYDKGMIKRSYVYPYEV